MAPIAIALQILLDLCNDNGLNHDIVYNPFKSICMVFKPPRFSLKCPPVSQGQTVLEYKSEVKYFGVWLSDDCTDNIELKKETKHCMPVLILYYANFLLARYLLR